MATPPYSRNKPFQVTVHHFPSPTPHSCAYELGPSSAQDALVFIGGLGDGPHTVGYITSVAHTMFEAAPDLSFSVWELRMSSSFASYGFRSLKDDVADLSALARYLRGLGKRKIVFFGHSTGCQDCMEYTDYAKHRSEPVDGFILQGPVSDREAFGALMPRGEMDESLRIAGAMIAAGNADAIMPRDKVPASFDTPITAYRWRSLLSAGGDDDFFSSDLPDDKLASAWGKFRKPVLILPSGDDEHVPATVDVSKNVERWKSFCAPGLASELSGLIPGADHAVQNTDSQVWLSERVITFLRRL